MRYICTFLLCTSFFIKISQAQFERNITGVYNQTIFNKKDGKLYTVYSDGKDLIQYLAVVDPRSIAIEKITKLPNLPISLALSSDAAYLYVGSDSIHRYNLQTKQFDQHFGHQLGNNQFYYCNAIIVNQERAGEITAFWGLDREFATQYRNGIRFGSVLAAPLRSRTITTNGKNLYFFEGESDFPTILQIAIKPDGLEPLSDKYNYLLGRSSGLTFFNGRLYSADGTVLEIPDQEHLKQVALLPTKSPLMAVVPYAGGTDTLYIQLIRGKQVWLQKYDQDNFHLYSEELLSTINIDNNRELTGLLPLNNPREFAVFSAGSLYVVHRCISKIKSVPAFKDKVYYACYADTLTISAPGEFLDGNYFWSNGFRGKTFTYPVIYQQNLELSYRVADDQGCLSPASEPTEIRYVYLVPQPPQIQSKNNQTVLCQGGFLELNAIEEKPQYERLQQYLWSNGQTGRSIRVTSPGTYTCRIRSWEGCLTIPSRQAFVVKAVPDMQVPKPVLSFRGGDTLICSGDSVSIMANSGYPLYLWSDGFQGNGPTRPLPLKVESISVQVRNAAGCYSEVSEPLSWHYFERAPQPVIQRSGNLLASSAHADNQWFLNNKIIPGATGQFLKTTEKGTYTVQVIKNQGCPSRMSEPILIN